MTQARQEGGLPPLRDPQARLVRLVRLPTQELLLNVNGAPYPIEYTVRNCRELGGDIKNLSIHAGPKGCKGYNKGYALAFQPPLRICVCAEENLSLIHI